MKLRERRKVWRVFDATPPMTPEDWTTLRMGFSRPPEDVTLRAFDLLLRQAHNAALKRLANTPVDRPAELAERVGALRAVLDLKAELDKTVKQMNEHRG